MSTKSLLPTHKLQCFSVACLDMPRLEFGDKVVLPPNILLELQCVKVPNPFLFSVQATDVDLQLEGELDVCSSQYCSVQEFSAPDGQVFLPYWLMQNLGVSEGGAVVMTSVINLPRGIYCRFQPETMSFLDLAADIGPKLLMETTLRRYSVLSEDSTIVIEYRDTRYYVRVAELKPASVVSLCGDVDLETDFMPPDFECSICHEEVLRRHENQHQHCPHCSELYENIEALADHHRDEHTASFKCSPCGTVFTRSGLQNHLDNSHCDHVWMPKDLTQHSSMCSNRTDRCPVRKQKNTKCSQNLAANLTMLQFCKLYVKITEFDTHQEECTAFTQPEVAADSSDTTLSTSPRRKASSQNAVECAYCLQGGFSDIAAVERHVLHGCRIARSFAIDTVQDGKSNQEKAKAQSSGTDRDEIPRPLLAQGRMRRKGDFSALRGTPSQLRLTRLTNNNQLNHLIGRNSPVSLSPTVLPQARAELQAGKQRKPKPRPNPQLRALPKRTSMLIEDPEAKTSSVFAGLCISSAGGTSLAAPAQSRANTRVRGRHTGKGPSRLDKLL
ncbi:Ubiquitin fusion degradation protein 1 [Phytophthora citrophthora]|uniref:Ubiquitin fusion degradation protein 1 n=1 Tax=Phytophthora citrophthora TaxID=4793 RepID=A0AAD9GTQ1_9STRA|nr:Ubiquitin fusion degradation protein 1 [Phytophthora citrophthora]